MGPEKVFLELADALLSQFNVTSKANGEPVDRYALAYAAQAFADSLPEEQDDN